MKRRIWLFILSLCSVSVVLPQTETGPPTLTVKVQALSALGREIDGLYWFPAREWTSLRAPSEFLPPAEVYTGPNPIRFYRQAPPEEGGQEPRYVPVTQVLIPQDADQVILLFTESAQRLFATAVPLLEQNFPRGSYMVFNQSGRGLVMILEEKPMILPAGAVQVVIPDNRDRGPVPVVLRFTQDGDNSSLITSTWFHHPERRRLVFLFQAEEQIQVRGITWYPGGRN